MRKGRLLLIVCLLLSTLCSPFLLQGKTSVSFVYASNGLSVNRPDINWGTLKPGTNTTETIIVTNLADTHQTLNLSLSGWIPVETEKYLQVTWDYDGTALLKQEARLINLTLHVSSLIKSITDFSFNIIISAESIKEAYRFMLGADKVYVGDPASDVFVPKLTFTQWNNESWFSLLYDDSKILSKAVSYDEDKVKYVTSAFDFHYYVVNNTFFEFEIILKRPFVFPNNQLAFPISANNLVWHYQPSLTEELNAKDYDLLNETHAIKDGVIIYHRPLPVVGSYAAYHRFGRGNEYGTGKALHVYRPFLYDTVGNSAWADLSIINNKLVITLPDYSSWVYPITIDPWFGSDSAGASGTLIGNDMRGISALANGTGTADSITVRLARAASGSDDGTAVLYWAGNSSKLAETQETTCSFASAWVYYWFTFNFTGSPQIDNVSYYIVAAMDLTGTNIYIRYDSGSGVYESITYPTFPDPASFTGNSHLYSIFCNFTEAGGISYYRNITQSISWSSNLDHTWTLSRVFTQSVSWSSSISRDWNLSRVITQAVSWSSSLDRSWTLSRAFSLAVNWASSLWTHLTEYTGSYYRAISLTLDWQGTLTREWTLSRDLSLAIDWSSIIPTDLEDFYRAITLSLTIVWDIVNARAYYIPEEYATRGFVLATLFLIAFIGFPIFAVIWRIRR